MKRENSIKVVLFLLCLTGFCFISVTLLNNLNTHKLTDNPLPQLVLQTPIIFYSIPSDYFTENYNGFIIKSDKEDFTRIKLAIDNLRINSYDYFNIKYIYYIQDNSCDGLYSEYSNSIYLYSCYKDVENRNYKINAEDIETFILAHELGHFIFIEEYGDEEDRADDYAHELSGIGEKIR